MQPKPEGRDEVVPFLIEKLQERRELGIQKYGEPLKTFNGRNQSQDALEELLDFVQYFTAKLLEDGTPNETLEEVRSTFSQKLAELQQENEQLKAELAVANQTTRELNEQFLGLSTTLSTALRTIDEAVKTLALKCAANMLLER